MGPFLQLDWQIKTFFISKQKRLWNRNSKEENSSSPKRLFRFANEMAFVCIIQVMMSLYNPPALQRYVCKWNYSRLPSPFFHSGFLVSQLFKTFSKTLWIFLTKKAFVTCLAFGILYFLAREKSQKLFFFYTLWSRNCVWSWYAIEKVLWFYFMKQRRPKGKVVFTMIKNGKKW